MLWLLVDVVVVTKSDQNPAWLPKAFLFHLRTYPHFTDYLENDPGCRPRAGAANVEAGGFHFWTVVGHFKSGVMLAWFYVEIRVSRYHRVCSRSASLVFSIGPAHALADSGSRWPGGFSGRAHSGPPFAEAQGTKQRLTPDSYIACERGFYRRHS
jgi:hypothetical protein